MNLAFPLGLGGHAQGSAYTAIAPYRAAHNEGPTGFDITREMTSFRHERR
jgi:hypothetical protein